MGFRSKTIKFSKKINNKYGSIFTLSLSTGFLVFVVIYRLNYHIYFSGLLGIIKFLFVTAIASLVLLAYPVLDKILDM